MLLNFPEILVTHPFEPFFLKFLTQVTPQVPDIQNVGFITGYFFKILKCYMPLMAAKQIIHRHLRELQYPPENNEHLVGRSTII